MKPQPYLCVAGYEVLNDLRTRTYMRRGLIDSRLTAATATPYLGGGKPKQVAQGDVYQDTYQDLYGGSVVTVYGQDALTPENLAGYCHAIDDSANQPSGNYLSPKDDDAPWYTAARPESADYMGMTLRDITVEPVVTRVVNTRSPAGAALGAAYAKNRVLSVTGIMYAASDRGMAWGERWLTDVLAGQLCNPNSELGDVTYLPSCPPLGDEDRYFRTVKRAGLVDGPHFSELGRGESVPECVGQQVQFQLISELPWLFGPATALAHGTFVTAGHSVQAIASTNDWVGDAGVRLTITPMQGNFGCTITATPLQPGDLACPSAHSPAFSYTVAPIPEGNYLVFDSATRSLLEWDAPSQRFISGMPRLSFAGPFGWLEVPPCSQLCVVVTAGGGPIQGDVLIEQLNREL